MDHLLIEALLPASLATPESAFLSETRGPPMMSTETAGPSTVDTGAVTSEHISVHIIDVAEIIGSQRVGRLQMLVIALCAAIFADGFDMQVMGYIAPSLARDWHQEYLTILVVACVAAEWTPLRSEGTGRCHCGRRSIRARPARANPRLKRLAGRASAKRSSRFASISTRLSAFSDEI